MTGVTDVPHPRQPPQSPQSPHPPHPPHPPHSRQPLQLVKSSQPPHPVKKVYLGVFNARLCQIGYLGMLLSSCCVIKYSIVLTTTILNQFTMCLSHWHSRGCTFIGLILANLICWTDLASTYNIGHKRHKYYLYASYLSIDALRL